MCECEAYSALTVCIHYTVTFPGRDNLWEIFTIKYFHLALGIGRAHTHTHTHSHTFTHIHTHTHTHTPTHPPTHTHTHNHTHTHTHTLWPTHSHTHIHTPTFALPWDTQSHKEIWEQFKNGPLLYNSLYLSFSPHLSLSLSTPVSFFYLSLFLPPTLSFSLTKLDLNFLTHSKGTAYSGWNK